MQNRNCVRATDLGMPLESGTSFNANCFRPFFGSCLGGRLVLSTVCLPVSPYFLLVRPAVQNRSCVKATDLGMPLESSTSFNANCFRPYF